METIGKDYIILYHAALLYFIMLCCMISHDVIVCSIRFYSLFCSFLSSYILFYCIPLYVSLYRLYNV